MEAAPQQSGASPHAGRSLPLLISALFRSATDCLNISPHCLDVSPHRSTAGDIAAIPRRIAASNK
jgi:hypothetical protein